MSEKKEFTPEDVKKALKASGIEDFDSAINYIAKHSSNSKDYPNVSLTSDKNVEGWFCCMCSS